jgi:hypothetical protein
VLPASWAARVIVVSALPRQKAECLLLSMASRHREINLSGFWER